MERPVGKDPLERSDGKDPFDFHTYYAENGLTITTMIDFRAFCAAFFETYVRTDASIDESILTKFIKLITRGEMLFKRARAVIPELQVPREQSFHDNANVRKVLLATRELRGSSTRRWSNQPEELAWLKLISEGRVLADKQEKERQALIASGQTSPNVTMRDENRKPSSSTTLPASPSDATGSEYMEGPSNSSVPARSNVTTEDGLARQVSDLSAQAITGAKSVDGAESFELKRKARFEDIPTFVPKSALGNREIVWSPTLGSRLRRPDETYQAPVARPILMASGQILTPTYGSSPSQTSQYQTTQDQNPVSGMTENFIGRSGTLHSQPSSSGASKWFPTSQLASNQASLGSSNLGHAPPGSSEYTRGRPKPFNEHVKQRYEPRSQADRPPPISPITNMGGPRYPVNRTHGIPSVEPFSAPPNMQQFRTKHDSNGGAHGGLVVPSQTPRSRYPYNTITNNTTTSGSMTPMPRDWDVSPPNSISPLTYWDMVYHREHEIRASLAKSHLPPTEEILHYFAQLEQARINAVATNLPIRGNARKWEWISTLQNEMSGVWNAGPGSMPRSPVIIARKQDYEKAISEAIMAASMET